MNRRNYLQISGQLGAACLLAPLARAESLSLAKTEKPFIRLNANENPYGPSLRARKAIEQMLAQGNRYPDPVAQALQEEIAQKYSLAPEYVMLGAGSTEIIQNIGLWALHQKIPLIAGKPVFPVLAGLMKRQGGQVKEIPLNARKQHDLVKMQAALGSEKSLIYIVNPNNPTATTLDPQTLKDFCQSLAPRHYVLVDEAYLEYLPDAKSRTLVALVEQFPQLMVLKTFSKIYGLAGLRIGYVLTHPDTRQALIDYQAWPQASLNGAGLAAARASLGDEAFCQKSIQKNQEMLVFTKRLLDELNIFHIPSQVNFLYMNIQAFKGDLGAEMRKHRIILRPFRDGSETWCRVSMGSLTDMQQFEKVMRKIWGG
ncbi:MAG: histidinol-phosphate transaminase [Bacteroidota bacterium]